MFSTLQELFDRFTAPADEAPAAREQALRLATAVMLVEVMRADTNLGAGEREATLAALRARFALDAAGLDALVEQARRQAERANDYFHFTSAINDRFSQPEKIALIESMWQVAYADRVLDANENHVISKVAGLLHVTQGEYIGAKMRAKEAAGLL